MWRPLIRGTVSGRVRWATRHIPLPTGEWRRIYRVTPLLAPGLWPGGRWASAWWLDRVGLLRPRRWPALPGGRRRNWHSGFPRLPALDHAHLHLARLHPGSPQRARGLLPPVHPWHGPDPRARGGGAAQLSPGRVTETVTRTFAIDLRDGYGVTFSESTDRFRDLIATVGEQTRHIPYVWSSFAGCGRACGRASRAASSRANRTKCSGWLYRSPGVECNAKPVGFAMWPCSRASCPSCSVARTTGAPRGGKQRGDVLLLRLHRLRFGAWRAPPRPPSPAGSGRRAEPPSSGSNVSSGSVGAALLAQERAQPRLEQLADPVALPRLLGGVGAAVGAGVGQRLVGLGDVDDPRADRDLLPAQGVVASPFQNSWWYSTSGNAGRSCGTVASISALRRGCWRISWRSGSLSSSALCSTVPGTRTSPRLQKSAARRMVSISALGKSRARGGAHRVDGDAAAAPHRGRVLRLVRLHHRQQAGDRRRLGIGRRGGWGSRRSPPGTCGPSETPSSLAYVYPSDRRMFTAPGYIMSVTAGLSDSYLKGATNARRSSWSIERARRATESGVSDEAGSRGAECSQDCSPLCGRMGGRAGRGLRFRISGRSAATSPNTWRQLA